MAIHKVGVIGFPIDHSLSPVMHNAAFAALGMTDWLYDKIALMPDILKLGLRELRDHGYIGVNVTIPHKQAVMPYVKPDATAQAVGAVNTIDFRDNTGTNTDVIGLMDDLAAHDLRVSGETVIVLGAGGAARAAVYGLTAAGAHVIVVNRSADKARALIDALKVDAAALSIDEAFAAGGRILIHCTPVGMYPKVDESPLVGVPHGVTLYDMIYRPAKTRLMDQVEAAGGRAVSGLGMLARQGAAAFRLWTGVYPPVEVMITAAQDALAERR
jgi:shikimate dehydrogenase